MRLEVWGRFPRRELCKETHGSPEFTRLPYECVPWSQSPVVTSTLAMTCPGLLPSGFLGPSVLTSTATGSYHQTTTIDFSGLNTEAVFFIRLASDSRYQVYHQASLLTCRLSFVQVGLAAITATHLLTGNNQLLSRTGLPRLCNYLGTTGNSFKKKDRLQLCSCVSRVLIFNLNLYDTSRGIFQFA